MFAVPPIPEKENHFVPQLSKRKKQYKGLGISNNFLETDNSYRRKRETINIGCKKTLVDNGAIMGDDVILKEIGREIFDYYWPNCEMKDNYIQVFLSSGESVLARTTDKKTVEVYNGNLS